MKALAVSQGIPADAIILETQAGSTRENILFTKRILDTRGWRHVLLVSSAYYMRRALLTFRRNAPEMDVIPTPSRSRFYSHNVGATAAQLRGIVHEYLGLAYYWWEGWI